MDEYAFPPTGFAVAGLGCMLQHEEIGAVNETRKCCGEWCPSLFVSFGTKQQAMGDNID